MFSLVMRILSTVLFLLFSELVSVNPKTTRFKLLCKFKPDLQICHGNQIHFKKKKQDLDTNNREQLIRDLNEAITLKQNLAKVTKSSDNSILLSDFKKDFKRSMHKANERAIDNLIQGNFMKEKSPKLKIKSCLDSAVGKLFGLQFCMAQAGKRLSRIV